MKKLFFALTLGLSVLVVSCNKDQAAVKKLDGTWNVTKMSTTDGGFSFDFIALGGTATMNFDGCKLKKDEWCTATSTFTFGGDTDTETMVYRVTGDGTVLESKEHADSTTISTMTIVELSKDKAVFKQTEGTAVTDIEATKAD